MSKTIHLILTISALLAFGKPHSIQTETLTHTFKFLDRNGLVTGYELNYYTKSDLNKEQTEILFKASKSIVRAYGREIEFSDFYIKRDSIESQLNTDLIKEMVKQKVELEKVEVLNLLTTERLFEAINQRARALNEPKPERIKVMDN